MSGHIFFKHRWYGFDDALYAAVRLIEAVSASGKTLTEIMDAMPKTTATPEFASRSTKCASSPSSRKFATGCPRTAQGSTPPMACASARMTAGGRFARRTRRTSSSPAPKRRISQASIASSGRSTSSSPLQASSAGSRALVVLVLVADEVQLAGLDLVGHAPMLQRFLAAVGDPDFARREFADGRRQLVPVGMIGNDQRQLDVALPRAGGCASSPRPWPSPGRAAAATSGR